MSNSDRTEHNTWKITRAIICSDNPFIPPTQAEMACIMGVSLRTVQMREKLENKPISRLEALALSRLRMMSETDQGAVLSMATAGERLDLFLM